MFELPAAAIKVGNQSRPEKSPFSTVPGLICPGQRIMAGTRKPPSPTVPLVFLNGVMPPSGQVNTSAPLSVVKITIVLLASPMSSRCFKSAHAASARHRPDHPTALLITRYFFSPPPPEKKGFFFLRVAFFFINQYF